MWSVGVVRVGWDGTDGRTCGWWVDGSFFQHNVINLDIIYLDLEQE